MHPQHLSCKQRVSRVPGVRVTVEAMARGLLGVFLATAFCAQVWAEKVLVYDEERGIIFVDKEKEAQQKAKGDKAPPRTASGVRRKHDIHVGRKKDPPELYFKSGLQYFRNGDYLTALKNFTYARAAEPNPKYFLWMGKTYRQLEQNEKMMEMMHEILKRHPESDVADDALFEIAFYYQKNDDYDRATQKYAELAEQYPFGVSFSNGEEFLEVSRKQRQLMRAEMVSALKVLGFTGKTPADAYRAFQKVHRLEVNGRPTRETVMKIKTMYNERITLDAQISAQNERVRQSTLWVLVAASALALNLWILIAVRAKAKQRKRHLANLENILSDLDTKSLR